VKSENLTTLYSPFSTLLFLEKKTPVPVRDESAKCAPAVPPWFPKIRATQFSEQWSVYSDQKRMLINSSPPLITGPG